MRVWLRRSDGLSDLREVKSGHSYLSQGALELHYGLGGEAATSLEGVVVRWPSGVEERLDFPGPGRHVVVEGLGFVASRGTR